MKPQPRSPIACGAVVILAAFLSVGCDGDPQQAVWWQGEQQRIELSHQLELKQFRFDQSYTRDFEEYQKLRQSVNETAASLKSLHQQRITLGDEVESMQSQWADFRDSTIREQRQRAMGKTFETLRLVSGRTFDKVSVSVIDDGGVTIRHADGSARLRFGDLDAGQRVFFGLEADLALAAAEKETRDAADYEHWVDTRLASIDEQKQRSAEISRREDETARRNRAALVEQQLTASNERPLAQAATSVGGRSWNYSSSYSNYRTYRPSYRSVYYYNAPGCSSISRYPSFPAVVVPSPRVPRIRPTVVTPRQSLSDTTLPSIP